MMAEQPSRNYCVHCLALTSLVLLGVWTVLFPQVSQYCGNNSPAADTNAVVKGCHVTCSLPTGYDDVCMIQTQDIVGS